MKRAFGAIENEKIISGRRFREKMTRESITPSAPATRRTRGTVIRIAVVVLLGCLVVEGLVYALVLPCFEVPVMVLTGTGERDDVARRLGDMQSDTWISFDTERAGAAIAAAPYIESVTVEKHFPDKVFIDVVERTAIAKTILNVNGAYKLFQIDKNCVIYRGTSDLPLLDGGVPLITGLDIGDVQEGESIPAEYRTLVKQISDIQGEAKDFLRPVSEIHVSARKGGYELALYPDTGEHVRVRVGRSLDLDTIRRMLIVLDVVDALEPNVEEIDLRYGATSYVRKSDTEPLPEQDGATSPQIL